VNAGSCRRNVCRRRFFLCHHPCPARRAARHLQEHLPVAQTGGYLLATVGSGSWTGTEDDWLGAPMYWSHADRATYVAWLEQTGFEVLWTRFIPEGTGGHTLIFAKARTLPSPASGGG